MNKDEFKKMMEDFKADLVEAKEKFMKKFNKEMKETKEDWKEFVEVMKVASNKAKKEVQEELTTDFDFDAVEKEFDKGHESRPSVDAAKNAGTYFCFIEIKGWKKYLEWNKLSEKGILQQKNCVVFS